MAIITESIENENRLNRKIEGFFKTHQIGEILKQSNAYKSRGIAITRIMAYLTQLVFTKKSMYMHCKNGTNTAGFGKDTVYRLLNATFINWGAYLLKLAMSAIKPINAATSEERRNVLILDDTLYERPRSKKVELLANVYDHAAKAGGKFKRPLSLISSGTSACSSSKEFKPNSFSMAFSTIGSELGI